MTEVDSARIERWHASEQLKLLRDTCAHDDWSMTQESECGCGSCDRCRQMTDLCEWHSGDGKDEEALYPTAHNAKRSPFMKDDSK